MALFYYSSNGILTLRDQSVISNCGTFIYDFQFPNRNFYVYSTHNFEFVKGWRSIVDKSPGQFIFSAVDKWSQTVRLAAYCVALKNVV